MRSIILFVIVILFSHTLFAQEHISLQLKWKHQFQFAGYYMAKEKGFYRDAGLDVTIKEGFTDIDVVDELLFNNAEYAVASTRVLEKIAKGADLLFLAAIYQSSPFAFMTTKEHNITSLSDFKNKRLMTHMTELHDISLLAMLRSHGVNLSDIDIIQSTHNLTDLVKNRADIMTVYLSNEPYYLQKMGYKPVLFTPQEYGFNFYNDLLVTSQNELQEHPKRVQRFLEATLKGWEYAFGHIEESVDVVYEKYNTQHKSKEALLFEAKALKPLAYKGVKHIGEISYEKLQRIVDMYVLLGLIPPKNEIKTADLIFENLQKRLVFSKEEKEWMKQHPVVCYSEVNWKPLSIIENGIMTGILGDYLELVEKKTGLEFRYVAATSRSDVLKKFKEQKIDVVPGIGSSEEELSLGLVSSVYASYPMVIVTTEEYRFVNSLEGLRGKRIAVPKDYTSYFLIKERYPDIVILQTKDIPEALLAVESGRADAFVGHIATSLYYIAKLNLKRLKVAGTAGFDFQHRYLVQKDEKILRDILNKVIAHISEKERSKIYAKWVYTKVQQEVDYTIYYQTLFVVIVILLILFYRQKELHKVNQRIEALKERMELALLGSNDVLVDYNLETKEFYLSKRWGEILQRDEAQSIMRLGAFLSYMHPKEREKMQQIFTREFAADERYIEFIHRQKHRDGHWVWMKLRVALLSNSQGQEHITGTLSDISKEKKMELVLKQQAQALREIHDSIVITDLEGIIVEWNRGSEEIFGYKAKEVIGKHIVILSPDIPKEKINKALKKIVQTGYYHDELYRVTKAKKKVFISLSLSILKDEDGNPTHIIGYAQDRTYAKKAEEKLLKQTKMLHYQAYHDSLTGLPNRVLFDDRLTHAISSAKRNNTHVGVFFVDLDRFKEINDSLGHKTGDKLLQFVAKRLKDAIRAEDTLARLGGDEFTLIVENLANAQDASFFAHKIMQEFREPFVVEGHRIYVTCSIGISMYPEDSDNIDDLLKYADAAMYKAKDEGKNNFQFYTPEMTQEAFTRMLMETSLREAIEKDEFAVYFQPQYDARLERLVGMEALIRWQHPTMGLVSPATFIPLAESTGLIVPLDRLMMQKAIKTFSQWCKEGLQAGRLSMNLSIHQLDESDFTDFLQEEIEKNGCSADDIELEVLEGELMKHPERSIAMLQKIHNLGITLAVDDFGTGYSSLSYLKRLPIDKLKIDQSFVRDLPSEEDSAIIKAIIALARSLHLELIAEGVEKEEQKVFLLENGCYEIQGYLYSEPLSAEAMKKRLLVGKMDKKG